MTGRKYYTDPIAAAWMAKHFGMRFAALMNNGLCEFKIGNLALDLGLAARYAQDKDFTGIFAVEPDSLPILEPRVDDLISMAREHGGIFCEMLFSETDNFLITEGDDWIKKDGTGDWRVRGVIQRGGKPFHWPEEEA